MDRAPGAPEQPITFERPAPEWPAAFTDPFAPVQPSAAALPVLRLTPVPGLGSAQPPWAEGLRTVAAGVAVLVVAAEFGRRAGAPGRLTACWTAGACAAAVGPWLVPHLASHLVPRLPSPWIPDGGRY
jgi:hypothetical protein